MSARRAIAGEPQLPREAWPRLLSREQLCGYLGVCPATLTKICPVPPVALGANVVRWNRVQIDAWLDALPPRLQKSAEPEQDAPPVDAPALYGRALSPVEKARARAVRR